MAASAPRSFRVGILSAEVGFPEVFEDLLDRLAPRLKLEGLEVNVERVRLGPFRVDQPEPYDLVIDRISHGNPFAREWLKVAALAGTYVVNHPFHFQSHSKTVGYAAMSRLGFDVPETWALPPKDQDGLRPGVAEAVHSLFSLGQIGGVVGYPHYLKPHDGGGWIGVSRPESSAEMGEEYDQSGARVMLAQSDASAPGGRFVRCLAVGPRVAVIPYAPGAPHHARYLIQPDHVTAEEERRLVALTRVIGAFHGFEFNTAEFWLADGEYRPIDFYNAVPDCSPASLHRYCLWGVTALVEWVLFCLIQARRPRLSTRMARWLELGETPPGPARDSAYATLAAAYYEMEEFARFEGELGADIWDQAAQYNESATFLGRLREAVGAGYPEHEVDAAVRWFQARIDGPMPGRGPWYPEDEPET